MAYVNFEVKFSTEKIFFLFLYRNNRSDWFYFVSFIFMTIDILIKRYKELIRHYNIHFVSKKFLLIFIIFFNDSMAVINKYQMYLRNIND